MTGIHSVLVVEDDVDIRESMVEILSDEGYMAIGACDGRDALEKLRAATITPCLILLDLMMPVMDGTQFRAEQLRNPALSDIPVVVISAYRDVEENARNMHAAALLKKPVGLQELLDVVAEHC